jgi:hypothetical protein
VVGIGWETNDFVENCGIGFGRDIGISESRLCPVSLSVFEEVSSSDDTIKSSSDEEDRDNNKLSWSDSIIIGSIISLLSGISLGFDF